MKIKRNIAWSLLDYGAVPIGMIAATPILTQHLGLDRFGVLVLVTALVAFGAVFNFGFGDTTLKFVSQYMETQDRVRALTVVRTIGALTLIFGTLIAICFMVASPTVAVWLRVNTVPGALEALFLTGMLMPLKMLESVYIASLRGCNRYDLAGKVTVLTKLVGIALQVSLAVNGHGLPGILLAGIAVSLISTISLLGLNCRILGFAIPGYSASCFAEIRTFSGWSWVQGIAGLVYANIDRIIISAILGPVALGIYGVCIQLAQNIHYALAAASHSLFPLISRIGSGDAKANSAEIREIFLGASRRLSVIAVVAGTVGAVFSYEILEVWVGASIAREGGIVLSLLCLSYGWFAANSIVPYYTLNGLGLAGIQAGVSVTGGAIMGAASLMLIPLFGLAGAGAARFPDALFRLCVRSYIARKVIGNISYWTGFDFLRITLIAGSILYFMRKVLISTFGPEHLLFNPVGVLAIVTTSFALLFLTGRIEFIISRRNFPGSNKDGTDL